MSRTNVDLDDKLVKLAMTMSALKTKKELIHVAKESLLIVVDTSVWIDFFDHPASRHAQTLKHLACRPSVIRSN